MTKKTHPRSTLYMPPTPRQVAAIANLAMQLGDKAGITHTPVNRKEARDLLYKLRIKLKESA